MSSRLSLVMPFSARERELLGHLGALGYLTFRHIDELLFAGSTLRANSRQNATSRLIAGLRRQGLLTSAADPRVGAPTARVYSLTRAGMRALALLEPDLPQRRCALRGGPLEHALMVAEIALSFRCAARRQPGHRIVTWECDWRIDPSVRTAQLVPDARLEYLSTRHKLHAFVEADRATEGRRFFAGKIARYLDLYRGGTWRAALPVWPLVLTVAPTAGRAHELRQATETVLAARHETPIAPAFRFGALEELRGEAGPLAEIWEVAGRAGRHRLIDVAEVRPVDDAQATEIQARAGA